MHALEAAIVYHVRPANPHAHLYEITLRIDNPDPEGQELTLPAWIPGSYLIRDYARHVVRLEAEADGEPVTVRKSNKHTWRVAPVTGPLLVRTQVYAADPSVRGAWLDGQSGFFNGVCLFLRVVGQEDGDCLVHVDPPELPEGQSWRLATSMSRLTGTPLDFGAFSAGSYDELIDHPILMGPLAVVEFEAAGVPHLLASLGADQADAARLKADLARLCAWQVAFFGLPVPMDRYAFLLRAGTEGYGGLEHRASSALLARRDDLPRPGVAGVDAGYCRFLGLVSHEYFHTWLVKRIRPAEFVDADLGSEAYTRQLWIFEGITSYYDDLALLRCGLISVNQYLEILGRSITQLYRTAGRRHQTLEEASFDAWIKFYRPDENTPNATVSYYLKGSLVALALDLEVRQRTAGAHSLDEILRALWQDYPVEHPGGLVEGQFEAIAAQVSGLDLEAFFRQALRTNIDPPLGILLAWFGIRLHTRAAESDADAGGAPGRREDRPRAWLGLRTQVADGRLKVSTVVEGGPAERGGVAAGDILVALGDRRIGPDNLDALVERLAVGTATTLHVFRDQRLCRLELWPETAPRDTCYLTLDPDADAEALARRALWLQGGAVPPASPAAAR
jgi:predicted metalloprotease with PDZ domain